MIIRHVMYGVCKRRKQETAKTVLDDILSERDVLKLLRTYGFFDEARKKILESTPILIPLVPLYHLKDIRFIVA